MNKEVKTKVTNAFNSILRSDYISLDDMNQLYKLEDYYIDYFNNLSSIILKQDNYICGRRGTGKTTLLYRSYLECLKTISPKYKGDSMFGNEKVLPIFIDISNCVEIFNVEDDTTIERHFIREIISYFKSQLAKIYNIKPSLLKRSNNVSTDLEIIEQILIEGRLLSTGPDEKNVSRDKQYSMLGAGAKVNPLGPTAGFKASTGNETELETEFTSVRGLNVSEFLSHINSIRVKANINSIYIFIDEFSDLNNKQQELFSRLLKKLLGSKINVFFKIGVITDRYYFGNNIILGRDIFPVNLDLNDYVEKYDGTVAAIKKMKEFVTKLIEVRLEVFCNELRLNDIFSNKNEIFNRIATQSLGVSRTIGIILQNAWSQAQIKDNPKIGLQEINFGIRNVRKTYYRQFSGAVKNGLIDGFYMDMWNSILSKAIGQKNKHPDRPASHMLIDPIRKDYLNILCENFLIHFLEENRTSKYGGKYNLYCLDYDVCLDNNIKFAEVKDEFTAARFIYDEVLKEYDPYFINEKIKSYRCPECDIIYSQKELQKIKVKRCFECDSLLEEIIHKESPKTDGNYAEVEIKILGLITSLENEEEAESALEISNHVGCSLQKVSAWCTKVLYKRGMINIIKRDGRNYYYSK